MASNRQCREYCGAASKSAAPGRSCTGLALSWRRETEPRGHVHQVREKARLHLSHHLAAVSFDGDLTNTELARNLFIQPSGDDQFHDFAFAAAERLVAFSERAHLGLVTEYGTTSLEGLPDGAQQRVVAEWLGQEVDRPTFHGAYGRLHIAMARDEDDRHVDAIGDALL